MAPFKFLSAFLFLIIILSEPVFGFESPFKKKYNAEKEMKKPMVQTREEWLEEATSVKMDLREESLKGEEITEKFVPPKYKTPLYLVKYNMLPGTREIDLFPSKKEKLVRSVFVADPSVDIAGYTESYYYPQTKQTASAFYIVDLNHSESKKERLKNPEIFSTKRYPLISTALSDLRDELFSTLTIVDFSKDGKKVLLKEKTGSAEFGIYETYVWIFYITKENKETSLSYANNLNVQKIPFVEDFGNDFLKEENSSIKKIDSAFLKNENKPPKANLYGTGGVINEEELPYLTTDSLNNFIKSNWKEKETSSGIKTRWYQKDDYIARASFQQEDTNEDRGFGVRLNLLNETIKSYWLDRQKLVLGHIKWGLQPLGFSANNPDEIIVQAFAYGKDGNKISLGNWGVDTTTGTPRLILQDETISIESNGLMLQERLN